MKASELKGFGRMGGMAQQFLHGLTANFSNSFLLYPAVHGYGTSPRNEKTDIKRKLDGFPSSFLIALISCRTCRKLPFSACSVLPSIPSLPAV